MARLITQFRLGLSPLHYDLFSHNNPFCPGCGEAYETLAHFLLECPAYAELRVILLHNINRLFADCAAQGTVAPVPEADVDIVDTLIRGSNLITTEARHRELNKEIFACLFTFITGTGRFKSKVF